MGSVVGRCVPMEADQRGRSECNVGESNESTISASADGSVDLRTAFGTVFNTRSSDGPTGPGNPSLADFGSEARPQPSNEEVARAATQSRTAASVQFSIDTQTDCSRSAEFPSPMTIYPTLERCLRTRGASSPPNQLPERRAASRGSPRRTVAFQLLGSRACMYYCVCRG